MSQYNIVVALTGSIACFKACSLISSLVQAGHSVKCISSKGALHFIGKASLEGISGNKVLSDTFEEGRMMDHIHLTDWCDAAIIYPASASSINRMASGFGDGPLIAFFLAYDWTKPFFLAPAMNDRMLEHPIVAQSIDKLKEIGMEILEPERGFLACRKIGKGRVCSPEKAEGSILSALKMEGVCSMHVLITAGGMEEPIDEIRSITNKSTGETGLEIAKKFLEKGHSVTFLSHKSIPKLIGKKAHVIQFTGFDDFKKLFEEQVEGHYYDAIIHAAACSDYSVSHVKALGNELLQKDKISSLYKNIEIHMRKNPKLLNAIKDEWGYKGLLVGFKLTAHADLLTIEEKVKSQFNEANVDLTIHNDLSLICDTQHSYTVYERNIQISKGKSKKELALFLEAYLTQKVQNDSLSRCR